MRFQISLKAAAKEYLLQVQRVKVTAVSEQFIISNRNETQQVIIQSNRPFFRNRNMKHRRPDYTVVSGNIRHKDVLEDAFRAIMDVLEPPGGIPPAIT